jgi:wobble nucleotide-excising tRNase
MDESAPSEIATPDKILSEGEKLAVALADFLTEVALDTTSRAIILDDPVTSLDLEWRER